MADRPPPADDPRIRFEKIKAEQTAGDVPSTISPAELAALKPDIDRAASPPAAPMVWVLIGIERKRYVAIAPHVVRIRTVPGVVVEVSGDA
jgi:hypothetical protein